MPGISTSLRLPQIIGKTLTHTGDGWAHQCGGHFHPDGSITADPEDIVWGGYECSYTIVTGIHSEGNIRENYVRINRWPHLTISRRKDWGWEMSNFVCAYSSLPDACKEGGTGPMVK